MLLGPVEPYRDYDEAAAAVLKLLQENIGFGLWLVTRQEEDDWIVLTAQDRSYGVKGGDVLRWSDSFCSRMVEGLGPNIAPIAADIESYARAPIASQLDIGAYIGIPLRNMDGSLFGTLCAVDPEPQPPEVRGRLLEIATYARLLGTILSAEIAQHEHLRQLERAEVEADTDALTGLFNRRGWERLLEIEEKRCKRYGGPAGVVALDIDKLKAVNESMGHAAGDQLLRRAARVLERTVRATDVVARLGGDEFGVLAPDESALALEQLAERLQSNLAEAGVEASVGIARRDPRSDLGEALRHADEKMRFDKKARRARG